MNVSVSDPLAARNDPQLPTLALALDPIIVQKQFKRRLARLAGDDGMVYLNAIRVTGSWTANAAAVRTCVQDRDTRRRGAGRRGRGGPRAAPPAPPRRRRR